MTEVNETSVEDLRKAVLHLTDAVRLIAVATHLFARRVVQTFPLSTHQDVLTGYTDLEQRLMSANDRLHAVVDVLVRTDDEPSS